MKNKVTYFTPEELAERWRLKMGTLYAWRAKGRGPKFIRINKKILYPSSEIELYERALLSSTSSQAPSFAPI